MATQTDLENAVRKVLNEGTGKGQKTWSGTEKAILAGVQQEINELRHSVYLLMYGDNADDTKDGKTHPNNLQEIRRLVLQFTADSAAREAAILAAAKTVNFGGAVDIDALVKAAEEGAANALARVQLTVDPEPAPTDQAAA